MHTIEILADFFNLVVEWHTAELPNLIPHQIFRLYGNYNLSLQSFRGGGGKGEIPPPPPPPRGGS